MFQVQKYPVEESKRWWNHYAKQGYKYIYVMQGYLKLYIFLSYRICMQSYSPFELQHQKYFMEDSYMIGEHCEQIFESWYQQGQHLYPETLCKYFLSPNYIDGLF